MLKFNCLALIFLLCITNSYGADNNYKAPIQTIIGADTPVPPGEMAILTISPIQGNYPDLQKVIYKWKILENGKDKNRVVVWPDNSQVFFGTSSQSGKIQAIVAVSYLFETKDKDGKIINSQIINDILYTDVKIDNNPNPPGPQPPNPPPNPEPTFPIGTFNLSKTAWKFATETVQLPTADKERSAKALANSFDSICARIAAGTIQDVKTCLTETAISNHTALKSAQVDKEHWDKFSELLQTRLYTLYEEKKLVTLNHYVVAWGEISLGLKQVR